MQTTEAVRPASAEELASALKAASDAHRAVVIRGAGTKMDWCRPAGRIDVVLETRGLSRLIEHQHGDLTATIEAGATLRDVNAALARHGQWLPLDPPFADKATIGGILACNDSGPLRHRFGTPRDLVIGVTLATTDGVLSKAGGRVVKNVAGYDLSKLVTGSFGSLAAIVSATFKLSPLPAAAKTLLVDVPDVDALQSIVLEVMASQVEPLAFEVDTRQTSVLLRFASLPVVVDAQVAAARKLAAIGRCRTTLLAGDEDRALWRDHAEHTWNQTGAVVRASWLPASIGRVIGDIDDITRSAGCGAASLVARAAVGAGLIRIDGDDAAQARAVNALRASRHIGNVVVVRGSAGLKAVADVWPPAGDRQPLLEAMKRAFDPHGVLNAGRGPV
jgi:glycolate oxidase FAD binding subunit